MESASFTTLLPDGLAEGVPEGLAGDSPRFFVPWRARQLSEIFGGGRTRAVAIAAVDLMAVAALGAVLEGRINSQVVLITVMSLLALASAGAYRVQWRHELRLSARFTRLFLAAIVALWLGSAVASVFRPGVTPRRVGRDPRAAGSVGADPCRGGHLV